MKEINKIYGITIAFLALWTVINAAAPTFCPYPSEEFPENTTTNIAHETDCTKYYKCSFGRGIEQDCPFMNPGDDVTRLHFNREKQVCDWPWQAGCHACPPRVNGRWPEAKLPDKDSCSNYFECINGEPRPRTCDRGCFSRTCQRCITPGQDRAGGWCPESPLPPPFKSSTTTTTRKPTRPTTICPDAAKRSHECNCALYYECESDLGWTRQNCGGGLHFSPTRKICLPPNEAGCIGLL